ncbi:MAG: tRNA isopentenyltransferase MiaA [Bacteroidetes bacterium]|nr:tRNA isopentenyltransferase MiaA [Bacteroidota bacterium]
MGPTASGKTRLACEIASALNGEIISADSRQVYQYLNIGTGKDLGEYFIKGKQIPYHLIDTCEPTSKFYLNDFMAECEKAFQHLISKKKLPVICGGTGLYLDSLRKDFSFTQIKENSELRQSLEGLTKEELQSELKKFPAQQTLYVDTDSKKRLVRAIEVATFIQQNPQELKSGKRPNHPYYIGIDVSAEERKKLITQRLSNRMDEGLLEEVEGLLNNGLTHDRLEFLGLEYKFVSYYLQNKITKEELFQKLQTAIFQFSKRQMTWFRKMEKEGVTINWIKRETSLTYIIQQISDALKTDNG